MKGLSKIDKNFDVVKESISKGGKQGAKVSNLRWKDPGEKEKQSIRMKEWASKRNCKTWNGKQYEITHPNGIIEIVEGLRQWCLDKEFNANTFANACLRGTKTHGGFSIKRIVVTPSM